MIEIQQLDQYVVKFDGSGRQTIRNSKFLRQYAPMKIPTATRTIQDEFRLLSTPLGPSFAATPTPTATQYNDTEIPSQLNIKHTCLPTTERDSNNQPYTTTRTRMAHVL